MPLANFLKYRENEKYVRQLCVCCGPDTSLPPEWEARMRQRVLTAARREQQAPAEAPAAPPGISRFRWFMSGLGAAAGLLLVAGTIWWLALGGTKAAVADFATVLQRVAQARTVEYDEIIRIPGRPETRVRVQMARPSKVRMNWENGEVHILDWESGKGIKLFPDTRKARTGRIVGRPDPLAQLEEAHVESGRFLRTEGDGNQQSSLYEVISPGCSMLVWVDKEQLPIRVEVRTAASSDAEAVTVMENFQWNGGIDESRFAICPPAGYMLENAADRFSEKHLIEMLRVLAECNGGRFPATLDMETITKLVVMKPNAIESTDAATGGEYSKPQDPQRLREIYANCVSGLSFVDQVERNGEWHFLGNSVCLGEKSKLVCWWRLGKAYRAVYGDLRIEELVPEEHISPSTQTE